MRLPNVFYCMCLGLMAMMNLSSIAHAKEPSAADFACHFQVDNIEKKVEINRFEGEHFLGRCGYPCNYDLANLAAIRSAKDAGFDEVSCHEVSRATESYWGSHNHDSINFGICQRCHSVVECNKPSERTLSQDEIQAIKCSKFDKCEENLFNLPDSTPTQIAKLRQLKESQGCGKDWWKDAVPASGSRSTATSGRGNRAD